MEENIQSRIDLTRFAEKMLAARQFIAQVIVGQEEAVELVLTAILADGHVLLEGVPGVAKTLLAKVVARLIDAQFTRIQFTPDLMPSDILGTSVFNMKESEFHFHRGPVFTDILLADEINRAPAKTQAALFEVMKITMGYPSFEQEVAILQRHQLNNRLASLEGIRPVMTRDELTRCRTLLNHVVVDPSLLDYMARVVQATRNHRAVFLGASPRAAVALLRTSKAYALLQGRDFVTPDDVRRVVVPVLHHRLFITSEAEMEGVTPDKVLIEVANALAVPR